MQNLFNAYEVVILLFSRLELYTCSKDFDGPFSRFLKMLKEWTRDAAHVGNITAQLYQLIRNFALAAAKYDRSALLSEEEHFCLRGVGGRGTSRPGFLHRKLSNWHTMKSCATKICTQGKLFQARFLRCFTIQAQMFERHANKVARHCLKVIASMQTVLHKFNSFFYRICLKNISQENSNILHRCNDKAKDEITQYNIRYVTWYS